MYREITDPVPPLGRMITCPPGVEFAVDPSRVGDTVYVGVDEGVDFMIRVDEISGDDICGEIVGIGHVPQHTYKDWTVGDKVKAPEESVAAIIRENP